MVIYVPGTEETDPKKQNMSLQAIGAAATASATAIAALNTATYVNSFNTRTGAVVPAQGDYPTSLIPGTTTNNNATAGNIGEYVESIVAAGSAVSISTSTAANITSISLTAGDWNVSAIGLINPAATTNVSLFEASVGTTTSARNTTVGFYGQLGNLGVIAASYVPTVVIAGSRFSLSATTTIYLVAFSIFTVSTNAAFGIIRARRVR